MDEARIYYYQGMTFAQAVALLEAQREPVKPCVYTTEPHPFHPKLIPCHEVTQ